MGRNNKSEEPTLAEAWSMLAERMGLTVEEHGDRSIRAWGEVRGRALTVEIEGDRARSEFARFLFGINTISSRNRRDKWHTVVSVGCANPRGITGIIESKVDLDDPAWNPREYNPRNGRKIRTDPQSLAEAALTAETHEMLMSIMEDLEIQVGPSAITIDDRSTAMPDSGAGYVAGSFLHHYQGSPQPWPERALAGPPWWIDLLCQMADTLDR